MANVNPAAGLRLTVLIPFLSLCIGPVWGQLVFGDQYNASRARPLNPGWGSIAGEEAGEPPQPTPASPAAVSAFALRHQPSSKTLRLLWKAVQAVEIGDDPAAIRILLAALARQPSAAPYVDNFLGLEYLKTRQFAEAKHAFEEAARLMPEVSDHHSNLGASLVLFGEWDSAEREARKALDLDRANIRAERLLALIASWREQHPEGAPKGPNAMN